MDLLDTIYPRTVKVLVAGGETGIFFFCPFPTLKSGSLIVPLAAADLETTL